MFAQATLALSGIFLWRKYATFETREIWFGPSSSQKLVGLITYGGWARYS